LASHSDVPSGIKKAPERGVQEPEISAGANRPGNQIKR
jgi:hypothetical protein